MRSEEMKFSEVQFMIDDSIHVTWDVSRGHYVCMYVICKVSKVVGDDNLCSTLPRSAGLAAAQPASLSHTSYYLNG